MGLFIYSRNGENGAALFAAVIAAAFSLTMVLSLYCNVMYEMKTMSAWRIGRLMRYDAEGGVVIAINRIESGGIKLEDISASGITLKMPGNNVAEYVNVSIIPKKNGEYQLCSQAVCDEDKLGDFPKLKDVDVLISRDENGKIKIIWGG